MATSPNLHKLKTSWTKYSIVQVLNVIRSDESLDAFQNGETRVDSAILKTFIGITSDKEAFPAFWRTLQEYPIDVKMIFGMMGLILTHYEIINDFAKKYASGNDDMKGAFFRDDPTSKKQTNIRSALVESGAASAAYRRQENVPYDFSPVFLNKELGPLFKELIITRFIFCGWPKKAARADVLQICRDHNLAATFSVAPDFFELWLQGAGMKGSYIHSVQIHQFLSLNNISLDFGSSREIYFLGENGDGKTLLLMAIFLAFRAGDLKQQKVRAPVSKALDLLQEKAGDEISGKDDQGNIYSTKHDAYLSSIYAYGPQRARTDAENADRFGFMTLFNNDVQLISPETWLERLKGEEAVGRWQLEEEEYKQLEKQIQQVTFKYLNKEVGQLGTVYEVSPGMLQQVNDQLEAIWHLKNDIKARRKKRNEYVHLSEILRHVSTNTLQRVLSDLLDSRITIEWEGTTPIFNEHNVRLSFKQLSEGYKSVIIFVVDLIYRLAHEEGIEGGEILNRKSIVLVDEIDLHIHPRWQQELVPKLRRCFPNIQFIFTTHSPTIIQAAAQDALIYRVYRQQGQTFVSDPYLRSNLNHLMINTLATSPIFGLEDARLDPTNEDYTTADTYALYRLNCKLAERLQQQFKEDKNFLTDHEIDELIDQILSEDDQDQ